MPDAQFHNLLASARRSAYDPRTGQRLTQKNFAELIGNELGEESFPSEQAVNHWENGRYKPAKRKTLIAIIKVLRAHGSIDNVNQAEALLNSAGFTALSSNEKKEIYPPEPDPLPTLPRRDPPPILPGPDPLPTLPRRDPLPTLPDHGSTILIPQINKDSSTFLKNPIFILLMLGILIVLVIVQKLFTNTDDAIGNISRILLYNSKTGEVRVQALNNVGALDNHKDYYLSSGLLISFVNNNLVLAYDSETNTKTVYKISSDENLQSIKVYPITNDLPSVWTTAIQISENRTLFYNSATSAITIGTFDAKGNFTKISSDHIASWTNITQINDDLTLFYDSRTGTITVGKVATDGDIQTINIYTKETSPDFPGPGWKHIVRVSNDILLFERPGLGMTVSSNSKGRFSQIANHSFAGWTDVIQSYNAFTLFYDNQIGTVTIGKFSSDGKKLEGQQVNSLPTGYTTILGSSP